MGTSDLVTALVPYPMLMARGDHAQGPGKKIAVLQGPLLLLIVETSRN